jgi:hypothetical protein
MAVIRKITRPSYCVDVLLEMEEKGAEEEIEC